MCKYITAILMLVCGAPPALAALSDAYYVAPYGNDTNAGTLAAPYATVAKCQTSMQASGTKKTCYIRAGNYTLNSSAGTCYGNTFGVIMTSSDAGETLSFYPPDGYGSAHFTGSVDGGICLSGSSITIDGLDIGSFPRFAIASGGQNNTIVNNTTHGQTVTSSNASIFLNGGVKYNVVSNNYVYNASNHGISVQPAASGDLDGIVVKNNFLYNTASNCADCGAIYTQDTFLNLTSVVTIKDNHIRDISGNLGTPGSKGIYLDDGASGHVVSGNVIEPGYNGWACVQIHGGRNNVFSGNICDESTASVPGGIVFYQTSAITGGTTMSGNVFEKNIITTSTSGAGAGYTLTGTPTNKLTVRNNDYYGYNEATPSHSGSGAVGDTDSDYSTMNPKLSAWGYFIAPCSTAFAAPTNFPTRPANWASPGFWGPPGFIIPMTGTWPSHLSDWCTFKSCDR